MDDHPISPEDFEPTGWLSAVCSQIVYKMLVLGKNWTTRFTGVLENFGTDRNNMEQKLVAENC